MFISRRALLGATGLAVVASVTACSSTTALATDLQLIANGLAAAAPLLPASAVTVSADVQSALSAVQQALAGTPSLSTIQDIGNLIERLAPEVVALFPAGGVAVTIVGAVIALLPTIEQAFGGSTLAARFAAHGLRVGETPAQARAALRTLPTA